jgi:rhodanese-related sulfurtransferase
VTYAGDIEPSDAYERLGTNVDAVLVDVRTESEWAYVGTPDLAEVGKTVILVTWPVGTDQSPAVTFLDALRRAGVREDQTVLFICRSGARSRLAAIVATASNYPEAYNVTHGFEGPPNEDGHRGTTTGWKSDNLPWRQS